MNNKPNINVTPLIDVLLVLLIIFMVISPLKPTDFKARIPQKPKELTDVSPNILHLVVSVNPDNSLSLNNEKNLGNVENQEKLLEKLKSVFRERSENGVYSQNLVKQTNLSEDEKIEKTVFIKASKGTSYGNVAKVIDTVKLSGANPISLQIDRLDQ